MRFSSSIAILVSLASLFAPSAHLIAADPLTPEHADLVKASLRSSVTAFRPGDTFHLGVHLKMKPHWHTYWVNPGESGEATKIKLTGPKGFEFGQVQWPLPVAIESFGAITYGYEDEVLLIVPVKVSSDVEPAAVAKIQAHVTWLACKDTCIEGEAKLALNLPIVKGGQVQVTAKEPGAAPADASFSKWSTQLPKISHKALASVEQTKTHDGKPQPRITAQWKEDVTKVQWFPIATEAVAIENIELKHDGRQSVITYKPNVYKASKLPGGKVEGVLIFNDAQGNRAGVLMSFSVPVDE